MSIEIRGLEEVIEGIGDSVSNEKITDILTRACLLVERSAKQKAPKGDGDLRRSIQSTVKDNEGIVFTPLEYAPYVEYGTGLFAENGGRQDVPWIYKDDKGNWHSTSGQHPQPYMRPALDENREQILKMFKDGITQND